MIPLVTIASKNYLAHVRTLAQSYMQFHPDGIVYLCLVDQIDSYFDASNEPFTIIQADALNIPQWEHFAFKYTILELNTAVKPFLINYLFQQFNLQKLVYFDPDIVLYHPLDQLEKLLDEHNIVLTPHILEPIHDLHYPSEMDLLLSGIYNLGFIALSRQAPQHEEIDKLLTWWQARLYDYCLHDVQRGLFVDQRWMDFAPALFTSTYIWRHQGANVAYWNFLHRPIVRHENGFTINEMPLIFMHYSGLVVENLELVSRYQNRYKLADLPPTTQALICDYRDRLLINNYEMVHTWPYAYGAFRNGKPISDTVRTICREIDPNGTRWADPFRTGPNSFYEYLARPHHKSIKLWRRMAISRTRRVAAIVLPPLLGETNYQRLRRIIFKQPDLKTQGSLPVQAASLRNPEVQNGRTIYQPLETHGINVIGYLRSETGVGEAARATIRILHSAAYPFMGTDVTLGDLSQKNDYTIEHLAITLGMDHPINLLHVNADQVPHVQRELGQHLFKDRYTIGFWFWELSNFPTIWQDRFQMVDEIWVASVWTQRSISAVSPKPVLVMPLYIAPQTHLKFDRAYFGLPSDKFLYLCHFDALSYIARKNPHSVIHAFKQAFNGSSPVQLVMKISHLDHSDQAAEIREMVKSVGGILIEGVMPRVEANSLIAACDSYISLHRAEGFGLGMAEAMYLGKPVIATAYSANMDFMNGGNSYPVDYTLVPISETVGPYEKGALWAQPDEDHAAALIRQVYEQPDPTRMKQAASDIRRNYGLKAAQEAMQTRLKFLEEYLQLDVQPNQSR